MKTDELLRYIAAHAPLAEIYLSGGEPFEHPDLIDIITISRAMSEVIAVYSSGTQRGLKGIEPLPERVLRGVYAAGLDRIDLSFYAGSPAMHDGVTATPGSFEATRRTAELMALLGLKLGIHFVPVLESADHLVEVAKLAEQCGATRLHVLALAPQGRAQGRRTEPAPAFLAELRTLAAMPLSYELVMSSTLRSALGLPDSPRDHLTSQFLDVDGFVYPGEGLRSPRSRSLTPFKVLS